MRRILLLAAVAFGIVGCDRILTTEPAPAPPPPPAPTPTPPPVMPPPVSGFNLTGTVRDAADNALSGATVTITDPLRRITYIATTDSLGYFGFLALPGGSVWTVDVRLESYRSESHLVILGSDRYLQIRMRPLESLSLIEMGKEYSFDIRTSDPPCDPVHWDASAPCVRLRFLAPRSGAGKVTFTWESSGDVDLLLMSDREDYLEYVAGGRSLELNYQFVAGTYYILWVHSYYGPATFKVRVDMLP